MTEKVAEHELQLVYRALATLSLEDAVWKSNYFKFARANFATRYRWWQGFKRQAKAGAPAPKILLAKVIQLRLTS